MIDGMAKKILFYGLDMLNHAIIIMTSFLPPFIRDEKKTLFGWRWDQTRAMTSRASSVLMAKPSAVAQSVEHPSKVPVWCDTSDVGSNPGTAVQGGRKTVAKK